MADRIVLITGGSTGIGAATARRAVAGGDRVVLAARRREALDALAAELGPDNAVAVACDVTEWDQVEALAAAALDRFGRIDVVFANAGFGATRGFLNETPEHWRAMVLTNVLGVAYTIRATLGHVLERGTGHYVLTSSIAGRRSLPGSLYSATKWAVTLIEPGGVETPFFDNPGEGRLEADDVAGAVIWALDQPEHVDVGELLILPTAQGAVQPKP
jgi:NADP-dependent 3-hydroxy acid dehydrogenase YdfG